MGAEGSREILVCVTFREFDGSANARIQERFLESLAAQTYRNFRVLATNFRETTVAGTLARAGLPHVVVQCGDPALPLSWSELILSSFPLLEKGKHIVLWTNADNVFDVGLFGSIVRHFRPRSGGSSYPVSQFAGLDEFARDHALDNRFRTRRRPSWFARIDPTVWVPEMMWIDGDLLLDPVVQEQLRRNRIDVGGPGRTPTLAIGMLADELVNVRFEAEVRTIMNSHSEDAVRRGVDAAAEPVDAEGVLEARNRWHRDTFCPAQALASSRALEDLCRERGIDPRFYRGHLSKWRLHRLYRPVGRIDQRFLYATYFGWWGAARVCRVALRNASLGVRRATPPPVRRAVRRLVGRTRPA